MLTDIIERRLQRVRRWKLHGSSYGRRRRGRKTRAEDAAVSFSAWTIEGWAMANVAVRRHKGETIEHMILRALNELDRRLVSGMPQPKPAEAARRKLRAAESPSKHVN